MGKQKQTIEEVIGEAFYKDIELPTPPPIITISDRIIATAGNFITVSGLPKSRKTTWVFMWIASALLKKPVFEIQVNIESTDKIILIDTEQGVFDFQRQIKILKRTLKTKKLPANFEAYLFRKFEPEVILDSILKLVKEKRPKILVIDNLTELVTNPNDMLESKKVIQFLKYLTAEFNLVIVCLLHLSKSNLSTLGNLGSYADRGSQSVLKVSIDKDTQISTIEPVMLRSDLYFNPVSILYDPVTNDYTQVSTPEENKRSSRKFVLMDLTNEDHNNRLGVVFQTEKNLIYSEIVEELKKIYGVGTNIAKQQIIPYLVGNKFLNSDKGIYTLNLHRKTNK